MARQPMGCDIPLTGLGFLERYEPHNVWHPGRDYNQGYGNDDLGTPIIMPIDGVIEYVSPTSTKWNTNGGFGNFIITYHPAYGKWMRHAHLNKVFVKKGDKIKEGIKIAECGNTGTTYAHDHCEAFDEYIAKVNGPKWRYYPTGKSKNYVAQHYVDPYVFINNIIAEEKRLKTAPKEETLNPDWLSFVMLGLSNGDRPKDPITREECGAMIYRAIDFLKKKE